jgi:hypothetical protein
MSIQQTLQNEIEASKRWLQVEKDDSTYKRDLRKRVELTGWVLEIMKNQSVNVCELMESKMNEVILKINQTYNS